jgi:hypothetical protein
MEALPLKRRWAPVILVGGVALFIGIGCIVAITWPAISKPSNVPSGGSASLWRVLMFDLLLLMFLAWGVWHLIALTLTKVDLEGITAPRLFRRPVSIRWNEIVRISGGPRSCLVSSKTARIRVSSLHVGGDLLEPTFRQLAPPGSFD